MANAIAWILVIFLGFVIFGFVHHLRKDPSDCTDTSAQGYAILFTQDRAKTRLFAPHTAEFDIMSVDPYKQDERTKSVKYRVDLSVSSLNVFGGPALHRVKSVFLCTPSGNERKWELVSFDMW